jgi:predicted secreted hydrolase
MKLIQWLATLCLSLWLMSSPAGAVGQGTVQWLEPTQTPQFEQAIAPIPLNFPQDFGPHETYQTEWWYYTGNLETDAGRPFGYELTLFRRGLKPEPMPPGSPWRSNQVYFAHFTLSDIQNQNFYPQERFSRGAVGLAGAQATPYRLWLDDWSIEEKALGQVQLQARGDEVAVDLTLLLTEPVLQGDRGYSVKGPEPGNASYYYSVVQQPTEGTVTVQGENYWVAGKSWTDHEYSTSALSEGTQGWDWFSLELEDGAALMLYGLRTADGSTTPESNGTYISPAGKVVHLAHQDFDIKVLEHWTSPKTKTKYPSKWNIAIPSLEIEAQVLPMMNNQELALSTIYWEGAVKLSGLYAQQPLAGQGYVEMTGYQQSLKL